MKNNKVSKIENFSGMPPVHPSASVLPDFLNGFLAVSESLQRYFKQNNKLYEEAIRVNGIYHAVSKEIDLSASLNALKIIDAQIQSFDLAKVFQSPVLELVNAANLSIGRLFEEIPITQVNELLGQAVFPSNLWAERLQAIEKVMGEFPRYDLALQSHLAEISELSVLSQAMVSKLAWDNIGSALDLQTPIRSMLKASFLNFAQSYSNLFNSWEKQPSFILSLPPVISKFSVVEFLNGVEMVNSITIKDYEDVEFQVEKRRVKEVREEAKNKLEIQLAGLNSGLIIMLRGARQCLDSPNPDHVRHFVTSLRELFTHVLHRLAPDDKVRIWSTDPNHYDRGSPTRRARLLYICQAFSQEPLSAFVEIDIDAGLEFLQLFQRGTHEVVPSFTNPQLRVMLARMEFLLSYLLEIGSTN